MVAVMKAKQDIRKLEELSLVKPFFGSKVIKKELGIEVGDRGYQWFAATQDGEIIAFAAIAVIKSGSFPFKGAGAEIKYLYVLPEFRQRAVGKRLMEKVLESFQRPIKATVTPSSKEFYEGFGFKQVYHRGQYPLMYREG